MTLEAEPRPDPVAAARVSPEAIREVLATLNALSLAEVSRVHADVDRARSALGRMGQEELASRLAEGQQRLRAGNVAEFRRAIANVTARLGHLK